MIRFDWKRFCEQYKIPHVTRGANTARNHISIKCPYCSDGDPSEHLGLCLDTRNPVWGCLRNRAHSGYNPARLLQRLMGWSHAQANAVIGLQDAGLIDDFELKRDEAGNAIYSNGTPAEAPTELVLPEDFRPLWVRKTKAISTYEDIFLDYLTDRGFKGDAKDVAYKYGLHFCLTGEYAWRIIIPFYNPEGILVGWTGRDIRPTAKLRYKTMSGWKKTGLYNSYKPAQECEPIWGDQLKALFITEGPFDAIKLDYYGQDLGYYAAAVAGTSITDEQIAEIALLSRYYQRIILLLDSDAGNVTRSLHSKLAELIGDKVTVGSLPHGIKDPGEMSGQMIKEFLSLEYFLQPLRNNPGLELLTEQRRQDHLRYLKGGEK